MNSLPGVKGQKVVELLCAADEAAIGLARCALAFTSSLFPSVSGSLSVGEAAGLLEPQTLQLLKKECGGLQTLLRNHHQVFRGQSPSLAGPALVTWSGLIAFFPLQLREGGSSYATAVTQSPAEGTPRGSPSPPAPGKLALAGFTTTILSAAPCRPKPAPSPTDRTTSDPPADL